MQSRTWIYPTLLIIGLTGVACRDADSARLNEAQPPAANDTTQPSATQLTLHIFEGQDEAFEQLFDQAQSHAQHRSSWMLLVTGQAPRPLTDADMREAQRRGQLGDIPIAELTMIESAAGGLVLSVMGSPPRSYIGAGVVVPRASSNHQALSTAGTVFTIAARHADGARSSLLGKAQAVSAMDAWLARWSS